MFVNILLIIISIIAGITFAICLIVFDWYLHIKKELEQEEGGHIALGGDTPAKFNPFI